METVRFVIQIMGMLAVVGVLGFIYIAIVLGTGNFLGMTNEPDEHEDDAGLLKKRCKKDGWL